MSDLSKNLPLSKGPGRFEGELELVQLLCLTSFGETRENLNFGEDTGGVDIYALINGPFKPEEVVEFDRECKNHGGRGLIPEEIAYLSSFSGVILHDDNFGFCSAEWFDDDEKRDMLARWEELEKYLEDESNERRSQLVHD
jgi:hypothetical protein